MDEKELENSLTANKEQVAQIEAAIAIAPDEDTRNQLSKLRDDLTELVQLTEASLLSLRKSKLLAIFDPSPPSPQDGAVTSNDLDAEFAAFQASIADDVKTGETETFGENESSHESSVQVEGSSNHSEDTSEEDPTEHELAEIVGTKCRVPFSQEWGSHSYYNAMVLCAEPLSANCESQVRVLFCNPTHRSMVPCPYFLEDRCKFDVGQCRFSHGEVVEVEKLEEFKEPDYSTLKMESKCLARYNDDVWYPATVVDVLEGHQFKVMFEAYENTETVELEDIVPQDEDMYESEGEDYEESVRNDVDPRNEEEDENQLPVYLWRPNQTMDLMGEWEKHTKGFGSRLMAKMGYIVGQGLGKRGEGRAEPVPIQLLPSGKSLDKIMELKERAGDQDLYDVMKQQRRKQHKIDNKVSHEYKKDTAKKINVFEFINKKLAGKKGNLAELRHLGKGHSRLPEQVSIGKADLKKRTDKQVNLQLFKTHGEIKNVEKEMKRLKESLQRNDGRDNKVADQVRQKLKTLESYLKDLESSQNSIQKHQQMRSDTKKLTIF